jgi:hypothetical protein
MPTVSASNTLDAAAGQARATRSPTRSRTLLLAGAGLVAVSVIGLGIGLSRGPDRDAGHTNDAIIDRSPKQAPDTAVPERPPPVARPAELTTPIVPAAAHADAAVTPSAALPIDGGLDATVTPPQPPPQPPDATRVRPGDRERPRDKPRPPVDPFGSPD